MVNVDEASIIKFKTHGTTFEILVDSNAAIAFKEHKMNNVEDIMAVKRIFSDARRGLEASQAQLLQVFNTKDISEVAKIILEKGEIPLTKEYKDNLRDQKKKQIINYIHRNTVDPQTHVPHPPQRIETALGEVHFHVDENEPIEKQVQDAIKKLRLILPLKFEIKEISIKVDAKYAHKCYQLLRNSGKLLKEEWLNDGSLKVLLEIPGGLEEDLYSKLASLTHGNIETEILNTKG